MVWVVMGRTAPEPVVKIRVFLSAGPEIFTADAPVPPETVQNETSVPFQVSVMFPPPCTRPGLALMPACGVCTGTETKHEAEPPGPVHVSL